MSLKTEIEERLPSNVYAVKVDRGEVRGSDTIHVVVYYRDGADKSWYLDMNFNEKNKMTAEHIAAVVNSYLRGRNITEENKLAVKTPLVELYDDDSGYIANWEGEGGNGTLSGH